MNKLIFLKDYLLEFNRTVEKQDKHLYDCQNIADKSSINKSEWWSLRNAFNTDLKNKLIQIQNCLGLLSYVCMGDVYIKNAVN